MNEEKYTIRNHEDYEMYTTTNGEGTSLGRLIVEFKQNVTIYLNNEEVIFHHCKKIVSNKTWSELSFYDKDGFEIVGTVMNIDIDYEINRNGYLKSLDLKSLKRNEGLLSFFEEEFGDNYFKSETDVLNFCSYFDIFVYDYGDMFDKLEDLHCIDRVVMDYVDVGSLAENSGYTLVGDDVWIDDESFNDFMDTLYYDFENDISRAIVQYRKDCQ